MIPFKSLSKNPGAIQGAVLAGLIAAGLGAYLWAVITIATGYQIGFMAIGVGVLVGSAVRGFGKGIEPVFGVIGTTLALLGCAAGSSGGHGRNGRTLTARYCACVGASHDDV